MTKSEKYVLLFAFRKHIGTNTPEIKHVVDEMVANVDGFTLRDVEMLFKELTDARNYVTPSELKMWSPLMKPLWERLNKPIGGI